MRAFLFSLKRKKEAKKETFKRHHHFAGLIKIDGDDESEAKE